MNTFLPLNVDQKRVGWLPLLMSFLTLSSSCPAPTVNSGQWGKSSRKAGGDLWVSLLFFCSNPQWLGSVQLWWCWPRRIPEYAYWHENGLQDGAVWCLGQKLVLPQKKKKIRFWQVDILISMWTSDYSRKVRKKIAGYFEMKSFYNMRHYMSSFRSPLNDCLGLCSLPTKNGKISHRCLFQHNSLGHMMFAISILEQS